MQRHLRTWLDEFFDVFGGRYVLASTLIAAGLFGVGLAIAASVSYQVEYLKTLPIYLGVFGVAWVGSWIGWGSRRLPSILEEIRIGFLVTDHDFERATLRYLHRLSGAREQVGVSIVPIVASWLFVWHQTNGEGLRWFRPTWSEQPHLIVKNFILDTYTVPISLLICTAAVGIVNYALLVRALCQLRLNPLLGLTRVCLRPLTDYGLATGLAWSVGVSLILVLFRPELFWHSIATLAVLMALGSIMMIWPHFAVHAALERTKRGVLDAAWNRLSSAEVDLATAEDPNLLTGEGTGVRIQLVSFIRSMAEERTWIYSPTDVAELAGTWLIPIATSAGAKVFGPP